MFKAGAKCFRSCDNDVLVMLIAVYGMMGCEEWNRSEPGPGSSTAAEETIALMSRVLAVVVPGAGVATGQCGGSVETWSGAAAVVSW